MHLHVGDPKKDLLFVYQFDVAIVAVALTDHSPFQHTPVAGPLIARHRLAIQRWKAEHRETALARKADRTQKIRDGIKPKKDQKD